MESLQNTECIINAFLLFIQHLPFSTLQTLSPNIIKPIKIIFTQHKRKLK